MKIDLSFKYKDLINYLNKIVPFTPQVTIVLGSGLGDFAETLNIVKSISTTDLPGYPPSTVEGHSGRIIFAESGNKKLLLFKGRIHFYEGYKIYECILPVFISYKLGCNKIIFTNAAGGIKKDYSPGDLMLAESFNGVNIKKELTEIIGIASAEVKNNLGNFTSSQLNKIIKQAAVEENIDLKKGTYWFSKGPSYETPAEINMMAKFRGDAVGMSTVHEIIFALSLGMEAASISCITNYAAGISTTKLSHEEVTETANRVKDTFGSLVNRVIALI